MNPQKIQALIKAAYLEAADWADDVRLDHAFLDDAEAVVTAFYEAFREEITWRDLAEQAGHDLWLTRQGHGAGFWDRPTFYGADLAQRLTAYVEGLGECDYDRGPWDYAEEYEGGAV